MKNYFTLTIILMKLANATLLATDANHKESATIQTPLKVAVKGSGRPMIFIPGLANSGEVWNSTASHFKRSFECHILTLPGFAGQPPAEGRFLVTMRDIIAAYIRNEELHNPILVGHSLGGVLVYMLGISEPELASNLIVVDAAPCPPAMIDENITADGLKQGALMGKSIGLANRKDFLMQQRHMLGMWITDKTKIESVMKWVEASDQTTVGKALGELWSQDLRHELNEIQVPLLLIAAPGPRSDKTRVPMMARYQNQLANIDQKKIVFAEDAKHFIMYDEPEWMWKKMEEFLFENSKTGDER